VKGSCGGDIDAFSAEVALKRQRREYFLDSIRPIVYGMQREAGAVGPSSAFEEMAGSKGPADNLRIKLIGTNPS
jgi:hypothetical protein